MNPALKRLLVAVVQLLLLPGLAIYVAVKSVPRIKRRRARLEPRRVMILTPYAPGTRSGSARAVRDMLEMLTLRYEVGVVPLRELRPAPGVLGRTLSNAFGSVLPMEDVLRLYFADPTPALAAIGDNDLALVEFVYGALFLCRAPRLPCAVILRDHEVLARRYAAELAQANGPADTFVVAIRLVVVWLLTLQVYLAADRIVALTPQDAAWLRQWFPFIGDRVSAIPVSFAVEPLCPPPATVRTRHMLYAANFFHQPNIDSLIWFLRECAPMIDADVTLHLVGVDEPLTRVRLPETRMNLVRHGHVEDIASAFSDVPIALAPIISGGGIRIKNLLFGSFGKAIVTTPLGNEGIDFEHGREAMICEGPAAFASAVNVLIRDPRHASAIGRNARVAVQTRFSPETILDRYHAEVFASQS